MTAPSWAPGPTSSASASATEWKLAGGLVPIPVGERNW